MLNAAVSPTLQSEGSDVARPRALEVVWTLAERELVRFVRQRNRVFDALGQPILFWLLFGAGLHGSFRLSAAGEGQNYIEYFFPGTLVLILLFTAIFATISIIEDRREGFLQSVLVAPIPRWALVSGKLLGGSLIAVAQGLVFLLLGLTLGLRFGPVGLALAAAFLFVLAFALVGLGFIIAWRMDSTQGFHAIMNVFLMPMWLLSGAFFPADSAWLGWLMRANPLTYGVAGVRRILYWDAPRAALPAGLPPLWLCWMITLVFALLTFALACKIAGRRTAGELL